MTTNNNKQECPVCGVTIENDLVKFSYGGPGTRQRLYGRVCQFIKKDLTKFSKCINNGVDGDDLGRDDYYD